MAESNLHPEQEVQKRRSTRIVQAVPLTVTGVDALGRPFQERTSTLIVNCHGARYQSKHYVLKNMWVTLEVPHNEPGRQPRSVRARVTWIQRPRTVRELFQIGVELETGGNVWGIAFPPADWYPFPEPGAATTPAMPHHAEAHESAPEPEDWSTAEIPAPHVPAPEQIAPRAERIPEARMETRAPEPVEDPAEEPVENPAESNVRAFPAPVSGEASLQIARQVARLVSEAKQQIQTAARESAAQAVASETRPIISALQAQMSEAAEKSVAAAVAAQLEKSQHDALQRMDQQREASMAALREQLAGELESRLSQARHQIDSQLSEAAGQSVAAAVAAQLEKSQQDAWQRMEQQREASMAVLREQLSAELDSRLGHARHQIDSQLSEAAGQSVAAAIAAQLEKSQQDALQRIEHQREASMVTLREQLSAELDSRLGHARHQIDSQLSESAGQSVAAAVAAQLEKSQREALQRMEQEREASTAAMLERLSGELESRLGEAREQIDAELAEVKRSGNAEFEAQIQSQLQAAIQKLENLGGSVNVNHDQVRAVMDQLRESSAKAAAEEIRRWQEQMDLRTADAQARLAQMDQTARRLGEQIAAATTLGEIGWRGILETDLEAAHKRWQEKLETSIEQTHRRVTEQLAGNSESTARQVEQQMQQRINTLGTAHSLLTSQAESVLGTLRTAISKETQKAEATIAQFRESVTHLEAQRAEFAGILEAASTEWARRGEAMMEAQNAEMNRRAESVVAGMALRLQPLLESAGQETIEKLAGDLEQRMAPQLARAAEILGQLSSGREEADKAIAAHQQRIWQVSERGVQDTAGRGKELLAQIENDFAESARAASARWLVEIESRATETSHSTFESLFKSADWYEKKIQSQMQTTLEKGLDQAATRLREKAAEMSGLFASELDHYSRSYVEHARGQMQENASDAAEQGSRQIAEAGDDAAAKFTERAAVLGREQFDVYAAKTKTAFEQHAAHMEGHTAQIRSKLEADAQTFAGDFQRALSQHGQQTLALGKQELGIQIDQAKDALLMESQAIERQFQSSLNSLATSAMDEHKQRLENASNSWLLTTVTKLNQQSASLIETVAGTTEERLKSVCGNVFSEMGETLRQRLAGLANPVSAPAPPASPVPPAKTPEDK